MVGGQGRLCKCWYRLRCSNDFPNLAAAGGTGIVIFGTIQWPTQHATSEVCESVMEGSRTDMSSGADCGKPLESEDTGESTFSNSSFVIVDAELEEHKCGGAIVLR